MVDLKGKVEIEHVEKDGSRMVYVLQDYGKQMLGAAGIVAAGVVLAVGGASYMSSNSTRDLTKEMVHKERGLPAILDKFDVLDGKVVDLGKKLDSYFPPTQTALLKLFPKKPETIYSCEMMGNGLVRYRSVGDGKEQGTLTAGEFRDFIVPILNGKKKVSKSVDPGKAYVESVEWVGDYEQVEKAISYIGNTVATGGQDLKGLLDSLKKGVYNIQE